MLLREYILGRILAVIPTAIVLSIITFFLIHMVPGDPVRMMVGEVGVDAATVARIRSDLGLDDPITTQYMRYVSGVVRGDFGWSFRYKRPVASLLFEQMPATLSLAGTGMLVAISLGVFAGVTASLHKGRWPDATVMLIALFGVSMPAFWFALLLLFAFALHLGWFPTGGSEGLMSLVLPAIAVGYAGASLQARLIRSSMLDVLSEDYIRTARSKGLRDRAVIYKHALRNALIPPLTMLGIQFGRLLGGTVVVETVFSRRGVGRLLVDAIMSKDYQLIQGGILLAALSIVMVNLVTDVAYGFIDPRIRYN